jgi:hypothetical protein
MFYVENEHGICYEKQDCSEFPNGISMHIYADGMLRAKKQKGSGQILITASISA